MITRPGLLALSVCTALSSYSFGEIPISGTPVPGMEAADEAFTKFMKRHAIPGGSAAIMKDGKLIYARGFGFADRDAKKPVQPDTLFRIASISKPITSLVIARLVEEGKLRYDQKAIPWLGYPTPDYEGAKRDPRLDSITIRQLLQHSGGWDRSTALNLLPPPRRSPA